MLITKSNGLLRKILIIVSFLTVHTVIFSISGSSAYWVDSIVFPEEGETISMEIQIGEWEFDDGGKGPPPVPSASPQPYDDYNLNEWKKNENLDQEVPKGQMFKYDDILYISISDNYIPGSHGLPGTSSNLNWAFVHLDLEWVPDSNYRVNSVVIREGRWFIANEEYNSSDWFVTDPLTTNGRWSSWREIEPMLDEHFPYFPDSTIKDYASPNWDYVEYK